MNSWVQQSIGKSFFRYAVVGILSNGVLYVLYLVLTNKGIGPKLAASIAYVLGIFQTFIFNRTWTFQHQGAARLALAKYVAIYGFGYFFNVFALITFVDRGGADHRLVQGAVVVLLAVILYALQKLWVFR